MEAGGAGAVEARTPSLTCEDEPEYDSSLCTLDWYSSDLNLGINTRDFCSAQAMSARWGSATLTVLLTVALLPLPLIFLLLLLILLPLRGFGYMWAGARATQGATRGRVGLKLLFTTTSINYYFLLTTTIYYYSYLLPLLLTTTSTYYYSY